MKNFNKNILANYLSQIYVTLIGIIFLPIYIKYMGSEAYGLVGFFSMLQSFFSVMDFGLSPTIGRETARYKGGAITPLSFRRLFRALSIIFYLVAFMGGGILLYLADSIASNWLNFKNLAYEDVLIAIKLMAVIVSLRWLTGLFRGVAIGSEKLIWLGSFNAVIATLRFIGVFGSMLYFGFTPIVFFAHQFLIAVIELLIIANKAQQLLPPNKTLGGTIGWSIKPVKSVLKFSLTVAFTAAVWIFVTNTDKLVLSGVLSLEDYGYFTMSVLVANGIMIVGGPVSSAILPRMTRLYTEGKPDEMRAVYRQSTQIVAIIAGSAAITLIATAKPLLVAWTGDKYLAEKASAILQLYSAGNLFLVIAAFSYYLQYAIGNLRYHLVGNIVLASALIPSIIIVASHFGAKGAGYVWLILNMAFLFLWVAYIHRKLQPNLHLDWLVKDILTILIPASLIAACFSRAEFHLEGRLENIIYVAIFSIIVVSCSVAFSSVARRFIVNKVIYVKQNRK